MDAAAVAALLLITLDRTASEPLVLYARLRVLRVAFDAMVKSIDITPEDYGALVHMKEWFNES